MITIADMKIIAAQKMRKTHFCLLRHHICYCYHFKRAVFDKFMEDKLKAAGENVEAGNIYLAYVEINGKIEL